MRPIIWGLVLTALLLADAPLRAQEPSALDIAATMEKAVVETLEKHQASVVAIARVRRDAHRDRRGDLFDEQPGAFPHVFETLKPTSPDFFPQEYGAGVVIDREGYIVTAYHVLGDVARNHYYVFSQRRPYEATVVAADAWLDIAVLKVDAHDLQPARLGEAEKLKKGQFVIALGNPHAIARDGQASAAWGLVSNLHRALPPGRPRTSNPLGRDTLHHYGTLIQTDARLERGASGGMLLNLAGEMVGLTTTFTAAAEVESAAGFAIPVDAAFKESLEQLKRGRIPEYGFLGISLDNLDDLERRRGKHGARVQQVYPGTPASTVDLISLTDGTGETDTVTHVNGQEVADANHLIMLLSRMPAQSQVRLTVERTDLSAPGRSRVLERKLTLSKKLMETARPMYATVVDPPWRGLSVEYATAVPHWQDPTKALDPEGCIGVLDVVRGSPAWEAGLRPSDFISHVGDQRVTTPAQFRAAVENRSGPVRLRVTKPISGSQVVRIADPM